MARTQDPVDCHEAQRASFLDCPVLEARSLTAELVLLGLRPPSPIGAEPGQFAMLRPASTSSWPNPYPLLGRPMSILGAGETLSFLVRRCGQGTELLTSLAPGAIVQVIGPVGRGWGEPEGGRELILVAGGVGVAPLLFAARAQGRAPGGERPRFLYGARRAEELVLCEEIERVAALELSTDDGSRGHHGPVTELLVEALGERQSRDVEVWTCGPEAMMAAVAAIAGQSGARCKVSVEARMACGRGLCLGCARDDVDGVPRYVCRDGPVFDALEVYDAASAGSGGG